MPADGHRNGYCDSNAHLNRNAISHGYFLPNSHVSDAQRNRNVFVNSNSDCNGFANSNAISHPYAWYDHGDSNAVLNSQRI